MPAISPKAQISWIYYKCLPPLLLCTKTQTHAEFSTFKKLFALYCAQRVYEKLNAMATLLALCAQTLLNTLCTQWTPTIFDTNSKSIRIVIIQKCINITHNGSNNREKCHRKSDLLCWAVLRCVLYCSTIQSIFLSLPRAYDTWPHFYRVTFFSMAA